MSEIIFKDFSYPRHPEVLNWVNRLVLDLKLQATGNEAAMSAPITLERLAEWSKLRRQLEEDTVRIEVKHGTRTGTSAEAGL